MYESIQVWVYVDESVAKRYNCFRRLSDGTYCIQSVDFIRLPIDKEQIYQLDAQFYELFIEVAPDERSRTYSTIEEAIRAHDREFEQSSRES